MDDLEKELVEEFEEELTEDFKLKKKIIAELFTNYNTLIAYHSLGAVSVFI